MDYQIKSTFLKMDILWERLLGRSGTGDPTFSAASHIFGKLMGKETIRITPGGKEVVSKQSILFDGADAVDVKVGDRFTLPGGTVMNPRQYTAIDIQQYHKGATLDSVEVYV